jgi:hypothetical protein
MTELFTVATPNHRATSLMLEETGNPPAERRRGPPEVEKAEEAAVEVRGIAA